MGEAVMTPTSYFLRTSLLGLGCVSLFLAVACSDDSDSGDANPGGSAGSGSDQGGSSGAAGSSGSGGSGGSSSGSAGSAGAGGSGAAGSSGSGGGGNGGEGDAGPGPDAGDAGAEAFVLTSTAFDDNPGCGPDNDDPELCDLFPNDNTGFGANVSPQFAWTGVPAATQSFVLVLHDLSNLTGQDPFTHWVLWNIPSSTTELPPELPPDENQGVPDAELRQISYLDTDAFAGSGARGNVYEFVLYALSTPTFEPVSTDSPDDVQAELEASGDVIDTTTMRARSAPPQ